jgi:hypothetical protein
MCEWVNGYQDHGPCKTHFESGVKVYFYGEVSNAEKGDLFSMKCLCNGDVLYEDEWNKPIDWSGNGCVWNWWTPSKDGTWKVKLYCNSGYIGSGSEFTVGSSNPFGKVKLEIVMQPYIPEEQITVLGEYTITNVGEEGSLLNWIFTEHPDFGSNWLIVPDQGYIQQAGVSLTGSIAFDRPYAVGVYEGDFKVQNIMDSFDSDSWHYILEVIPKTCFEAGTKITMADGSRKNIENVSVGDLVRGYNDVPWKVGIVSKHKGLVYEINEGLIGSTKCHPFYVKKQDGRNGIGALYPDKESIRLRVTEILKIEIGDKLLTVNGEWIEVTDITTRDEIEMVYNIMSLTGTKNYFANDILVYEEFPKWDYLIGLVLNQEHPLQYLLNILLQGKIKFLST